MFSKQTSAACYPWTDFYTHQPKVNLLSSSWNIFFRHTFEVFHRWQIADKSLSKYILHFHIVTNA